ncbi:Phage RecT family protein [Oenococcus oeni]|uniref:recombinase RecT n=1 Tax=Oenococcus oeni TaxID=1247 RepID=UPI00107B0FF3|nr:recombinase RecT [Oenococcus oeni]AVI94079.1 hypothetical protein AX764_04195 [Oenococcus oeni]SYV99728.1 Phage RecT family protein [Oenococcus oeni]SYW03913.1 Phage RecT family protein [Oenococcus oeni]SYW17682.1 Phage RecT family protein [Oenococcus oeni]VDC14593.1 Phage RecT family protein [Oenococcus oeni]
MSNELKTILNAPNTKEKFAEVLGKNTQGYINSVLNAVGNNKLLSNASASSILSGAMKAATLNLSIDPNLGYAYFVPYGHEAQLQVGYQGLIQLAQRSGQIKILNAAPIYEEQFKSLDPVTGKLILNKKVIPDKNKKPIGYVAYLKTVTGFEHTEFMSYTDIEKFAKRFSKSFNSSTSPWKTDFNAMAKKTLIKQVLKYAPMSIDLQTAVSADNDDIEVKDVTPSGDKQTVDKISNLISDNNPDGKFSQLEEVANANS